MPEITNLYEALVETKVPEDQCTNFFIWILKQLPASEARFILNESGIRLKDKNYRVKDAYSQYAMKRSRPDAILRTDTNRHIIIETKKFKKDFIKSQFLYHYTSGVREFGKDNAYAIFISGDNRPPKELAKIRSKFSGKIGFLSWHKDIIPCLDQTRITYKKLSLILKEFKTFLKYRLKGVVTVEDLKKVSEYYSKYRYVKENEKRVTDSVWDKLEGIEKGIVKKYKNYAGGPKASEEQEEPGHKNMPCIYTWISLKKASLIDYAYIFGDITTKKAAIILVGYQWYTKPKDKKSFIRKWNRDYKNKIKGKYKLYTWNDDKGVFDVLNKKPEMEKLINFYWGFEYDLVKLISNQQSMTKKIVSDFEDLLTNFCR